MFRPTEPISREQMASVLVRAFDVEGSGEGVDVVDSDSINQSHLENVEALVSQGISVTSDNRFRPKEDVTRAQFAVFLDRVLAYTWTESHGIESIEAINNTTVHVYFEEPIDEAPVEMFAFDNELDVLDTAIEDDGYTVVLTTSEQVTDQMYTLLINEARTNQVITGHKEAEPTPEPGTIEELVYALQEAYEQDDEVAFLEALTKINEYDEDAFEDSQVFPDYITSYLDVYDGQDTVEDLAAFVYRVNVETALIAVEAATEETIIGALSTLDLVTPEEYRLIVVSASTERIYEAISELDFESEDILDQIEEVVMRIGIEEIINDLHEAAEEDEDEVVGSLVINQLHQLRTTTEAFNAEIILPYKGDEYAAALRDENYPTGTVDEIIEMLIDVNDGETFPEIEVTIDDIGNYNYVEEELTLSGMISPYEIEWEMSVTPNVVDEDGDPVPGGVAIGSEYSDDGSFVSTIDMSDVEESGDYYIEFSDLWYEEEFLTIPFHFYVEPRAINELENSEDAALEHFNWLIQDAEDLGIDAEGYDALGEEQRQGVFEQVIWERPMDGYETVNDIVEAFNDAIEAQQS